MKRDKAPPGSRAPMIAKAVELYRQNFKYDHIADVLNAELPHPTGRKWSANDVSSMIQTKRASDRYRHGAKVEPTFAVKFDALLDIEDVLKNVTLSFDEKCEKVRILARNI